MKLSAPMFAIVAADAVAFTVKSAEELAALLLIFAVPALLVSLKRVCVLPPLLLTVAAPAVEVPKKLTSELVAGAAPAPPFVMMVAAVPAVVLS